MKSGKEFYPLGGYRAVWGASILSITVVLFMLGLLGLLVYQAGSLSDYVRENIGLQIELSDLADSSQILALKKELDTMPFTLRTKFISGEEAADELARDLGEDFVGFIGYNPLPNVIELYVKKNFSTPVTIAEIREQLLNDPVVQGVNYQESLVELVNRNIKRIGRMLLIFSVMLLFVSVLLIYNTIRLAVFARRLIIKSMLLVGATQAFIRKPFLMTGLLQGFISSLLAIALLWMFVFYVKIKIPELPIFNNHSVVWLLSGGIIIAGIVIAWCSSFFAVKKYLNINSEDLY
ncbi:MAG TPA: permease-like cell division protein FtsX [Bacteroidales bacterium]|nr:permease-like cell division protein FtsX [Bacteroidales bacterium]HPR57649.1 permease-like cell division protein FtsX [Bacteroidales bacterium]HRW97408.1 permease-like cell division protein FtsX [Bacteroidales bacterium]